MALDAQNLAPLLQPDWQILLMTAKGEVDITARFDGRLINLSITDKKGVETDELTLELDDDDGLLELPPTGALLSVSIGWKGEALVPKGLFKIDEIEFTGPPDRISLRGRGADVSATLSIKKERSWHQVTLGAMAAKIAAEHGLEYAVANTLTQRMIAHEDQTNESDVNLLTRLAKRFDAICTVKAGKLLIMPAGAGTTVSGKTLAAHMIDKQDCGDNYRFNTADREKCTGVRAYWHDGKASRRKSVLVGTKGNEKALRETYSSQATATQAAKAALQRAKRGQATFSLTLPQGRAELMPENPVTLTGFKPLINDNAWISKDVTHSLNESGFITSVELETR